jgi:hypothetical protein
MGEVLWALTRPNEPFPYDRSLSGQDDDDREADAAEYHRAVEIARAWAAEHGVEFDALPRRGLGR